MTAAKQRSNMRPGPDRTAVRLESADIDQQHNGRPWEGWNSKRATRKPDVARAFAAAVIAAESIGAPAPCNLSKNIEVLWLDDADHDLKPRKSVSGFSAADHLRTLGERGSKWAQTISS
jgi:hypothetical protein